MLNLKLAATKKDLQETAIIEQRRCFENERKKRIFNARERIIGIDKHGLEKQIAEKKQISSEQHEKERKILDEQERHNAIAFAKERELQMEKRRILNEINDFRNKFQKPQDRREFDLYDPHAKKKDLPARISDTDPRLTASSAQRFEGEDLYSVQRKRAQIEQQKAWLEQQMKERKEAEEARKIAERFQQEALIAREHRALELDRDLRFSKLKIINAVNDFNKTLASEQANQRLVQKRQEQEDNLAEQLNHVTSDILTEAPDAEKSSFGPHRIVPYSYRRMNPEQKDELKNGQQEQFSEIKEIESKNESIEKQWETLTDTMTRTLTLMERDEIRRRRENLCKVRQENQELASEQYRKKEYIDKVVYTNKPDEAYYQMFNTTSR